jgi:diguanylate cyclase (GGDEF)-like protein
MGPALPVNATPHERPAEGERNELLGFQRVLFWLRIVGTVLMVSQAFAYELIGIGWIGLVAALVLATAVAGWRTMHAELTLGELRRRGVLFLVSDLVAVYAMGTVFTPDPAWLAFYFYPLMSLEATLIAGAGAGAAVTGISLVVYGAQLVLHVGFGNDPTGREIVGAVSLIGLTGGCMVAFGMLADRGRRDLRILLDLTSALAHQRVEADTIELLDRRLYDAIGGRVRSIALRDPDGHFQIVRWHSDERRRLETQAIEESLGSVEALNAQFRAGVSITYQTDAWSVITSSLGLPEWARAVTLVPIFIEDQWVGVLPVLWPVPKTPDRGALRLLYGLANQVSLAISQGQLQRVREEAATDPLTRLLNRRAINDELAAYVARASRVGGRMAILFCDLDGFKGVNDMRGHEAGDAVLQAVSDAVRGALRAGDVVGRYGGDELLIVAADADAGDAVALARRVRAAVADEAGAGGVDMTIGIAVFPDDGRLVVDLMIAADQAVYRSKLRGPGQVVVAGSPDPHPEVAAG